MGPPDDGCQILIRCSCGQMIPVSVVDFSVAIECTGCGRSIGLPGSSSGGNAFLNLGGRAPGSPSRTPMRVSPPPLPPNTLPVATERWSVSPLVLMWTGVAMFAMLAAAFVVQMERRRSIAEIEERLSEIIQTAEEWQLHGSLTDGIAIEQSLVSAIADEDIARRGEAEQALTDVRQRLKQLEQQAETEAARIRTRAMLIEAQKNIEEQFLGKAVRLLEQYVADPDSEEAFHGRKLLSACRTATSDTAALEYLVKLDDAEFKAIHAAGSIDDSQFEIVSLKQQWQETVRRNLNAAQQQREELQQLQLARMKIEQENAALREAEAAAAAKRDQEQLTRDAAEMKDKEALRLASQALVLAAHYALVQLEIDRVKEITADILKSMDGVKSSTLVREIQALGGALRQEGTTQMRAELNELSRLAVDPALKSFHDAFCRYVEATIAQTHTHALAFENLSSPEGIRALRQISNVNRTAVTTYETWEAEWKQIAGKNDRTWYEFVLAFKSANDK